MSNHEFIQQLHQFISEHRSTSKPPKELKKLSNIVSTIQAQINSPESESIALQTGFQAYDEAFGGLIPGELMIIGGRPGMGKTQLLVQLALQLGEKVPVLYHTFDLTAELLGHRFIANLADIAGDDLLLHRIDNTQSERVAKTVEAMDQLHILVAEENQLPIHQLIHYWENAIEENGIQVIFVDYIQLLSASRYERNRHIEIGLIIQQLKKFAQQHEIALVVSSQLSRAVEMRGGDKRPQLADLRESGSLEQDADKVAFIYRPEYYGLTEDEFGPTEDIIHLVLAKNRTGKIETIYLKKTPNFNRIEGLSEATRTFKSGPRFNEFDEEDPF